MNLRDIHLQGKKVLVRVDFNVPLDKDFNITDATRINNALPTLRYILDQGGSIILMSHLGRPLSKLKEDGSINKEKFTLVHLVSFIEEKLCTKLSFAKDCGGDESRRLSDQMKAGDILLLENTRFYTEEKKGNEAFAKSLADLADIYVNDAFGAAHRAHASTTTVAQFFNPNSRAFGFLMENELLNGQKVLDAPTKPFVAIIGGAKVSDKIDLVKNLLDQATDICIGGGMAYTFIKSQGGQIGNSLCEDEKLDLACEILKEAEKKNCKLHLPEDSVCGAEFDSQTTAEIYSSDSIPEGKMGLDIGPLARAKFASIISEGKTMVWNGPMGVFEFPQFAEGTLAVARAVAKSTQDGGYSLIGGGDSVSAIKKTNLDNEVSFISTGGGAMLELLEGKTLPGVKAILGD